MTLTSQEKSQLIAKAASDKKALDIMIMNMHDLTTTTDYFIVCSATTATQVRAIADNIEDEMTQAGETRISSTRENSDSSPKQIGLS